MPYMIAVSLEMSDEPLFSEDKYFLAYFFRDSDL